MIIAPLPSNEAARLKELRRFEVLDTPSEKSFDDITKLAASICETPMAFISLVDTHRQWFKSKFGLEVSETSRDVAFCAHAILDRQPFIVPDAAQDPCFCDNPLVVEDPRIRFYAGIPLTTEEGLSIGTLCVIDKKPRELSPLQIEALNLLGDQIISRLVLRKQALELGKAAATLREAERTRTSLLRAINEAMEGMAILNKEGQFIYMNSAHANLYGYTLQQLMGQNWEKLYTPESFANIKTNCLPRVLQEGRWQGEVTGKTKTGEDVFTEISISLLHDEGDSQQWLIYNSRDITKRKKADAQLALAAREMEQRNYELALSKENALQATQAKSNFLAAMSHEIRTPMNSIVAMADLLNDTPLAEDQREYVNRLVRASTSLLDLISDELDMSKIEAGLLELQIQEFDLHDLVDRVTELLAARAHPKGLDLVSFIDPNTPSKVRGDVVRLRQVLVNLVGNAIKFTERGEVAIHVRPSEMDNEVIVFSVTDTGIGIPSNKLDVIFDKFSQVDASSTRRHGGTGLGLSITRELVELMGGNVKVESSVGCGSTFSFAVNLPVVDSVKGQDYPESSLLVGTRILVVDDHDINRFVLKEYLSRMGAYVVEASSGPEALRELEKGLCESAPIDLAFIDYRMPEMDGLELAKIIRSRQEYGSLPIIMNVSDCRGMANFQAVDIKVSSELLKPISRRRLVESLSAVFTNRKITVDAQASVSFFDQGSESSLKCNILVVDDLEDNRDLLALLLSKTQCKIEMAANGLEAFQKCQQGTYDLIFMDVQMPVMDGLQATAAIRQWENTQQREHTPIVALTAHAFREELDKCLAAGCEAHITKPIQKTVLISSIREHARKRS